MTIETIARLRELRAKATAGEWWASPRVGYGIDLILSGDVLVGEFSPDDAAAIVAAMNSLPALLECAEALEQMMSAHANLYETVFSDPARGIKADPDADIVRREARAALQALAEGDEAKAQEPRP
jgi:hypothetical protein